MNEIIWITFSSCLVLIMQGGFLALESGLTRSKNNINVAIKNLMDLALSFACFWVFGYALAFKTPLLNFNFDKFNDGFLFSSSNSFQISYFVFQALFCTTCSTIISGAVAERLKFKAYPVIVIVTSLFVYPVIANSVWSGMNVDGHVGWLYAKGFYDFAGATVVHSTGGWIALGIIFILGPRLGRFSNSNTINNIPGSNLPLSALGCVALWFGWLGFNSGSLFNNYDAVGKVISNTLISGSFATITGYFITFFAKKNSPQFETFVFSSLSGLVGITASCAIVSPLAASFIGIVSAILCYFTQQIMCKYKLDDVTGAVPVHLVAGIWGTLAVALFGNLDLIDNGLSRLEQFQVQLIGIVATGLWALPISLALTFSLKKINLLRVTRKEEIRGLNLSEHSEKSEFNELLEYMTDPELNIRKKENTLIADPYSEMGVIAMAFNRVLENLHTKEEELEKMNEVLLKRNKELKTYDHTVAHDLKNPIGVIRSYSDILLETEQDEDKKIYLNKIKNACNTSLEIIDGLLDLVQSDKKPRVEVLALKSIIDDSVKGLEDFIRSRSALIKTDFEVDYIRSNKVALRQICINLISNAIKYGPRDKQPIIRISTKKIKDTIKIEFEDNGIGIRPENYENIFKKLSREDNNGDIEGHGIGLSTVKNLVEKYQGSIEVSSIEKIGSIFTIYLPYSKITSKEKELLGVKPKSEVAQVNDNFRILAVDDDPSMLDILSIYLKKYYSQVEFASNGLEALDLVQNANSFDCILLDQSMPEMNGLETIKAIRKWEKEIGRDEAPIIALTAASDKDIIISLFDAGCDTYIEKPFNKNAVLTTIQSIEKKIDKPAA